MIPITSKHFAKLVALAVGLVGTAPWSTSRSDAYVDPQAKATPGDAIFIARSAPHRPIPSGRDTIYWPVDIRCILGTQGKNIVASWSGDGDTVQVVYAHDSGHPEEHMLLWYAQSFDGGGTWTEASSTLSPARARRLYPGIEQLTGGADRVPYIAWQQGYYSGGAYLRHPLFWTYDEFYPFMLFTPRCFNPADSGTTHFWCPSMEVSPYGDTILISAANINQSGSPTEGNAYIWRTLDGGSNWERFLMIDSGHMADITPPIISKGANGYIFAYFEWSILPGGPFMPYCTESFDCGETWSTPCPLGVPYQGATNSWYTYDVILDETDNYRPHIAVKFSPEYYEFSDIWELHPDSGSPGNWSNWRYTLLMGDPNGGQRLATQPTIGMLRGTGHIYITFSYFSDTMTGQLDIGMRCSTDRGQTWDPQVYQVTDDTAAEAVAELAYDVSNYLHILCISRGCLMHVRYPNPYPTPGVEEFSNDQLPMTNYQLFQNYPNPFVTTTTIPFHLTRRHGALNRMVQGGDAETRGDLSTCQRINLSIYDLTGRVVRVLVDEQLDHSTIQPYNQVRWDGTDEGDNKLASGVYFCQMRVGQHTLSKRIVMVR